MTLARRLEQLQLDLKHAHDMVVATQETLAEYGRRLLERDEQIERLHDEIMGVRNERRDATRHSADSAADVERR